MAQGKIYVGALAPMALVLEVLPGKTTRDPNAITGLTAVVRKPDGTEVRWAATKSDGTNFIDVPASTSAASYWVHPFDDGDVDQPGDWVAWAEDFQPSGSFPQCDKKDFYVSKR